MNWNSANYSFFSVFIFIQSALASNSLAVLYVDCPGFDSSARETFAGNLGRSLAADKSFLVYDARTRHGASLDRALGGITPRLGRELRERIHAGEIKSGLVLQCRLDSAWGLTLKCRFLSLNLRDEQPPQTDSAEFMPNLPSNPDWVDRMAKKFRALLGKTPPESPQPLGLKFPSPLGPARIIRGGEILASGTVAGLSVGSILETGAIPALVAVKSGKGYLFFFGHSRYGWLPSGTPYLEEGRLGMMGMGSQPVAGESKASQDSGKSTGKTPDKGLLITASALVSGVAKVMLVSHQGSLTRVELVQGEIEMLPALSGDPPRSLREMEWGETHGYEMEQGNLDLDWGESITRQLQAAAPERIGGLNRLLPRKLFGLGKVAETFPPTVQGHFLSLLGETDIAAAPLEKMMDDGTPLRKTPGNNASGCYLCRPDRLGP